MLHIQSLFALFVFLLVLNIAVPKIERTYPSVLGITANMSVEELVAVTNQKRAEAGLGPLTLSNELSHAASLKAQDMLTKNYWAHTAPDGITPWVFIKSAGYDYVYAGENLARGFTTAPDTVNAWMASPGHRDNMLSGNYSEIGFAIVTGQLTGDETVLVVEMFGSRSSRPAALGSSQSQIAQSPTAVPTVGPLPTQIIQPTVIARAIITDTPAPSLVPSATPTPIMVTTMPLRQNNDAVFVASVNKEPLIDRNSWSKMLAIGITSLFLFIFTIDMLIIERRQIVRLVSHNVDHILFLGIMLLTMALLGTGAIL